MDKLEATGVLTVAIEAAVTDEVTVAAGIAPSIEAAPGSAMTMVSARDLFIRAPANLMQAVENVPGVSQVSEGQAAVPAVRGLARGRTLILVDGSRVTSERRVGPSATFMDPTVAEGVDVARGPGSVAGGGGARVFAEGGEGLTDRRRGDDSEGARRERAGDASRRAGDGGTRAAADNSDVVPYRDDPRHVPTSGRRREDSRSRPRTSAPPSGRTTDPRRASA